MTALRERIRTPDTRVIALFAFLYALALTASSVDLSLTVQTGKQIIGSDLGGTGTYALIGLGAMVSARFGMAAIERFGPRRTFVGAAMICMASGALACYGAFLGAASIFYAGVLLAGLFIGVSNYCRLVVADLCPSVAGVATGSVLTAGIVGACVGPFLVNLVAAGPELAYRGYFVTMVIGVFSLITAMLVRPDFPAHGPTGHPRAKVAPGDERRLWIDGLLAGVSYFAMTVAMTGGPLYVGELALGDGTRALAVQLHLVAMYAPIFAVMYLTDRLGGPHAAAIPGVALGAVLLFTAAAAGAPETVLYTSMAGGGVLWAFAYSAMSVAIAGNTAGVVKPRARGIAEVMSPMGMILGAIASGFLFHTAGFNATYAGLGMVCLALIAGLAARAAKERSPT